MRTFKYVGPTKLVLAFDIGTTLSGVSYCVLESGKSPEVLAVTRYPGPEQIGDGVKVPSVLYYDKNGNVKAAGHEVPPVGASELELGEWTKAECWMLHLHPPSLLSSNKNSHLSPLPPGKSAVDVLTDFVKYLFEHVKTYIQQNHPTLTNSIVDPSTDYIFTHPNGWGNEEQQRFRGAIERACQVPATPAGHSRVHLLTACNAGLHFCIRYLQASQTPVEGVVMVDAGGGTIDLSVFSTTLNPDISCKEIAPAECLLQGSVFVTSRAKTLLQDKLRGSDKLDEIDDIIREFDRTTKLVIKSDQEPAYIRVAGRRYNNIKYNISFGKIKLTGKEATDLVNESLYPVFGAVEQQRKSAATPITAGSILLGSSGSLTACCIGGLATNDWFWSRLQLHFKSRNINAYRPNDDMDKAVANGAVWSYIDQELHLPLKRVAAATYGVVCSVPVDTGNAEHNSRQETWEEKDPAGKRYVRKFFKPILRKGSPVGDKMEYRFRFSLAESDREAFGTQKVQLMCYRGTLSNPQWVDKDPASFSVFCTISADLNELVKELEKVSGQEYYHLDYDVLVYFYATKLEAWLCSKDGEPRISATIEDGTSPHGI